MNVFDFTIISFLNQFAQKSLSFDSFMVFVSGRDIFKGGIVLTLLWWAGFIQKKEKEDRINLFFLTILSVFIVLAINKTLGLILPFRMRPLHIPEFVFKLPLTLPPTRLEGVSSFPSDHAALFFALSTGIFYMSRHIGAVAYTYTFFLICFPRIYLGLHYPTDIIGGILTGIGLTSFIILNKKIREFFYDLVTVWERKRPGIFYASLFFLSFEIGVLFRDIRAIVKSLLITLRGIANIG